MIKKKEFSPCVCPEVPPETNIPKNILQSFKVPYQDLPPRMKNATRSWQKLNPDYTYTYMDDEEALKYVKKHASENFLKLYKASTSGAMRCDLFRTLYIFREGGVYSDIDTTLRKPLDQIFLPRDDLVSGVGRRGDLHQWFLAYSPCHPVLNQLLEDIDRVSVKSMLSMGTEEFAGPRALHRAATKVLGHWNSFKFQASTEIEVGDSTGCRSNGSYSIRILEDYLGGAVDFKYEGYRDDLQTTKVQTWNEAENKSDSLVYFGVVGLALLVLMLVLECLREPKKRDRKSN